MYCPSSKRLIHHFFPALLEWSTKFLKQSTDALFTGWASRAYFSDNGSTAIEIALKMAFRKFLFDHEEHVASSVSDMTGTHVELKVGLLVTPIFTKPKIPSTSTCFYLLLKRTCCMIISNNEITENLSLFSIFYVSSVQVTFVWNKFKVKRCFLIRKINLFIQLNLQKRPT